MVQYDWNAVMVKTVIIIGPRGFHDMIRKYFLVNIFKQIQVQYGHVSWYFGVSFFNMASELHTSILRIQIFPLRKSNGKFYAVNLGAQNIASTN